MTHVCRPRPAVPILITRDTWHQRSRRIVTQQLLPSKDGTEQRKRWGYRWSPLWRWRQYAIYDDSTLMKSCIMCHVQKNVRIIAKALYLIEIETGWWWWWCEGVLIFIAQCQLGPRSCRVVTGDGNQTCDRSLTSSHLFIFTLWSCFFKIINKVR